MSWKRARLFICIALIAAGTICVTQVVYSQGGGSGPGTGYIEIDNNTDVDIRVFSFTYDPDVHFWIDVRHGDKATQHGVRRVQRPIDAFDTSSHQCIATGIALWPTSGTGNVIANFNGTSATGYTFSGANTP